MDKYLKELKKKIENIYPFKKKIIEGATGDVSNGAKIKCELNDEAKYDVSNNKCDCPTGTFYNTSDQCQKDIGTINVFLNTPIANCLVVALMSFLFAGFLFRIKSSPLAIVKGKCREIPLTTVFKTDPTQGIVYPKIFEDANKDKYAKMLFPALNKGLFPTEALEGDDGYTAGYIFKMPLYITLQYCSIIWYKTVSIIKQGLYKQYQWGYKDEIKKISRTWWIKDFLVIFLVVPILLFIVYPLFFVVSIIISMFVAPVQAIVTFLVKEGVVKKPEWEEGDWKNNLGTALLVLKYVGWVLLYLIGGVFFSLVTFLLTLGYFGSIFTGLHEGKRNGPEVVFKTWANIVWDYRYIWAILAGGMWILRFKNYLKSSTSNWYPMKLMHGGNGEIALGVITTLLFVLLGRKQVEYFLSLNKTVKPRCSNNCNAPKQPVVAVLKKEKGKDCVD